MSGSKKPAIDGTLVILAAGDKGLYDESVPAFEQMGKRSFLLSEDIGKGAQMKLVVNMIMGSMMGKICMTDLVPEFGQLHRNPIYPSFQHRLQNLSSALI